MVLPLTAAPKSLVSAGLKVFRSASLKDFSAATSNESAPSAQPDALTIT